MASLAARSIEARRPNKRKPARATRAVDSHSDKPTFIKGHFASYLVLAAKSAHPPSLVNDRALGGALPPRSSYQPVSPIKPAFKPIRHRCNMTAEERAELDAETHGAQSQDAPASDDIPGPGTTTSRLRQGNKRKAPTAAKISPPKAPSEAPVTGSAGRKRKPQANKAQAPTVAVEPAASAPMMTRGSSRNGGPSTRSASVEPNTENKAVATVAPTASPSPNKKRRLAVNSALARSASAGPTSPLSKEFVVGNNANTLTVPTRDMRARSVHAYSPEASVDPGEETEEEELPTSKRTVRIRDEPERMRPHRIETRVPVAAA